MKRLLFTSPVLTVHPGQLENVAQPEEAIFHSNKYFLKLLQQKLVSDTEYERLLSVFSAVCEGLSIILKQSRMRPEYTEKSLFEGRFI